MKKPKHGDAATEVECDACAGKGYPPVQDIAPGRRIYPAPCKKCGGKGRVRKPGQAERSAAARVRG
jgi:DnaJ-class molecular chaperone